jgi:hypothetical protein
MRGNIHEQAPNLDLWKSHEDWVKTQTAESLRKLVISYMWYLSPFLDRYLGENGLATENLNAARLIESCLSDEVMPVACVEFIEKIDILLFDSDISDRVYDLTSLDILFIMEDACRFRLSNTEKLLSMAKGCINLLFLITDDIVESEVSQFGPAYSERRKMIENGPLDEIIMLGNADLDRIRSKRRGFLHAEGLSEPKLK